MEYFPMHINIENIPNFDKMDYNRILSLLRQEIHKTIVSRETENEYIDLDIFAKKHFSSKYKNPSEILLKMVNTVSEELKLYGWKCKLSFADTGLFIYSTDKPPVSCWDSDF